MISSFTSKDKDVISFYFAKVAYDLGKIPILFVDDFFEEKGYGLNLYIILGNGIVSLICFTPLTQETNRSRPMPKPL